MTGGCDPLIYCLNRRVTSPLLGQTGLPTYKKRVTRGPPGFFSGENVTPHPATAGGKPSRNREGLRKKPWHRFPPFFRFSQAIANKLDRNGGTTLDGVLDFFLSPARARSSGVFVTPVPIHLCTTHRSSSHGTWRPTRRLAAFLPRASQRGANVVANVPVRGRPPGRPPRFGCTIAVVIFL